MSWKIIKNEFDSQLLTRSVGNLWVDAVDTLKYDNGDLILESASKEGFQVVFFSSHKQVQLKGFQHVGTVLEFDGLVDRILHQLCIATSRMTIKQVGDGDWDKVERLIDCLPLTRFSYDKNLSPERVKNHKIALLKRYQHHYPQFSLLAFNSLDQAIGLQVSSIKGDMFHLYEIMIKPTYRRGFVAVELLKENFWRMKSSFPNIKDVVTNIYSHNITAISFFSKIGMKPTGKRLNFYHGWVADHPPELDQA